MSLGLCNALSSFQASMNTIFRSYLRQFIIVLFFDNILIYSQTYADHILHLEKAFQVLLDGQFFLKLSKYSFAQKQVEYIGHLVSSRGVEPVATKVHAIIQWPTPQSQRALHGFLGLSGFCRWFIRGYVTITAPLTNLLMKHQFTWTKQAQLTFTSLKDAIGTTPILLLPNFNLPFVLETYASGVGMGVVLFQHGHPIAFFSKPFSPKLIHASTYVRKLFAIIAAVKKWHQYLLCHPFMVLMDHQSLKELMTQVVQTLEQQMYLARLIGYDYTIQYRSSKSNVVVDALSRVSEIPSSTFLSLSVTCFTFLEELKQQLVANPDFITMHQSISENPTTYTEYIVMQNLILQGVEFGYLRIPTSFQLC